MKHALVTGGSGDIGSSICQLLADDGFHIIVHANNNPEKAKALVEAIIASKGSAEVTQFDVTDAEASRVVLEGLIKENPVQVLVNNAGIHHDAVMAGMTQDQWREVIDVNLNGFFNVSQPLLLPMLRTRWGRIINISSVAAVGGNRGQVNYAASKAGLHGATRSLAQEAATRGVTVNAIAPGIIKGAMASTSFDDKTIKALVPMQRAGMPEEVAGVVRFLCSEGAGYISGQVINVNGGII